MQEVIKIVMQINSLNGRKLKYKIKLAKNII